MKSEKEKRGILLMLTIFSLLNIYRLAKRQYKKKSSDWPQRPYVQ